MRDIFGRFSIIWCLRCHTTDIIFVKKNFFMPHLFLFSLQLHFWNFLLEISIWNRGFKTERRTLKNDYENEDWNMLSFRRPAIQKSRVGRERMIKELNISFLLLGLLFSASSFRLRKSEDSMLSNVWNLPTFRVWFIDLVWVSFPFGFIDLKTLVWLALLFHSADALNMWRDLKQFFYLFRILCRMWNLMFFTTEYIVKYFGYKENCFW